MHARRLFLRSQGVLQHMYDIYSVAEASWPTVRSLMKNIKLASNLKFIAALLASFYSAWYPEFTALHGHHTKLWHASLRLDGCIQVNSRAHLEPQSAPPGQNQHFIRKTWAILCNSSKPLEILLSKPIAAKGLEMGLDVLRRNHCVRAGPFVAHL